MKVTDQMQREVNLPDNPKRIISIVPSQTQLLHALGLQDEVVGITKFCIHPLEWFHGKIRVGGTKKLNLDKIRSLNPDLILGNKEENEKSDIEAVSSEYPVWMSDIFNLSDALEMIDSIGAITGKEDKAQELVAEIQHEFQELESWAKEQFPEPPSVAYLIWNNPAYCAGKNTFIDAMMEHCGLRNYIADERYPELSPSGEAAPDFIFLSSEPFPFKEVHRQLFEKKYPTSKVVMVDGEMFSWYGSKLSEAPAYFKSLLEQITAQ